LNYRELLIKYIKYVRLAEGTDFIEFGFDGMLANEISFTEEEWAALEETRRSSRDESS